MSHAGCNVVCNELTMWQGRAAGITACRTLGYNEILSNLRAWQHIASVFHGACIVNTHVQSGNCCMQMVCNVHLLVVHCVEAKEEQANTAS